jgi:hypothetical protein
MKHWIDGMKLGLGYGNIHLSKEKLANGTIYGRDNNYYNIKLSI